MKLNKWVNAFTALRPTPSARYAKLLDIPAGMLVEATGQDEPVAWDGNIAWWSQVMFETSSARYLGWLPTIFLEDYASEFPQDVIKVRNATRDPNDAAQYIVYQGQTQYNLCGEFCASYCAGWDLDIEEWLEVWKFKGPNVFNRVFYGGKARTTGLGDLDSMLATFDYQLPLQRYPDAIKESIFLDRPFLTPERLQVLLKQNRVICSCRIESIRGRLKPSGIPHWIVLERVTPDRNGFGWMELYNPFPNCGERYSWTEFTAASSVYGLVVPR